MMKSHTKVMKADPKLKRKIEKILKAVFKEDYVDVSDGYADNVHVVIMSREFDRKTERIKQEMVWKIIDAEESKLTDEEKSKISLILPLSPDEVK